MISLTTFVKGRLERGELSKGALLAPCAQLEQGDEVSAYTTVYGGKDHLNDRPTSSHSAFPSLLFNLRSSSASFSASDPVQLHKRPNPTTLLLQRLGRLRLIRELVPNRQT